MSKLETIILEKANLEKEQILSDAKIKASNLYEKMIKEGRAELELSLEKAKKKYHTAISQKELEVKIELRDEVAIIKQKLVESVFAELTKHLTSLNGEALFNYVYNGLKNETLKGDETIAVNKHDYEKYQAILSSKKGDLVDCDLLNKKLGENYQIKLSNNPVKIQNGFILIGSEYDLNFSFDETIEKLAKKYEKKIYEELN